MQEGGRNTGGINLRDLSVPLHVVFEKRILIWFIPKYKPSTQNFLQQKQEIEGTDGVSTDGVLFKQW